MTLGILRIAKPPARKKTANITIIRSHEALTMVQYNVVMTFFSLCSFLGWLFYILVVFSSQGQSYVSSWFSNSLFVRKRMSIWHDHKYYHFPESERLRRIEDVKRMFQFGYDNYMKYAFPLDELDPIHCTGRGPDRDNP